MAAAVVPATGLVWRGWGCRAFEGVASQNDLEKKTDRQLVWDVGGTSRQLRPSLAVPARGAMLFKMRSSRRLLARQAELCADPPARRELVWDLVLTPQEAAELVGPAHRAELVGPVGGAPNASASPGRLRPCQGRAVKSSRIL